MNDDRDNGTMLADPPASNDRLSFHASDITNSFQLDVTVDRALPVSTVARSLAARLGLPDSTPYALRDAESETYLEEESSIGTALKPGAAVVLTPKAHLG